MDGSTVAPGCDTVQISLEPSEIPWCLDLGKKWMTLNPSAGYYEAQVRGTVIIVTLFYMPNSTQGRECRGGVVGPGLKDSNTCSPLYRSSPRSGP